MSVPARSGAPVIRHRRCAAKTGMNVDDLRLLPGPPLPTEIRRDDLLPMEEPMIMIASEFCQSAAPWWLRRVRKRCPDWAPWSYVIYGPGC